MSCHQVEEDMGSSNDGKGGVNQKKINNNQVWVEIQKKEEKKFL